MGEERQNSVLQHSSTPALQSLRPVLEHRSKALRAIRAFFLDRDFIEVETPVRVRTPALERHIDPEPSGDHYLRTSPELHMKRLLAAGFDRVFQLGPCFRRNERGPLHNPEYTMLEWYRANADYNDILLDTKALLAFVFEEVRGKSAFSYRGIELEIAPAWERISVSDAFKQFAGWDPVSCFDADRFDLDLVEKVEPRLPRHVPVVLADFPAPAAALARRKPGHPEVAERWELYIAGVELANAYSELTDPAEQRARFEECARQRKAAGKSTFPIDEEFLAALKHMPPSGGIALGVDRLVMLLTNAASLDEVLAFRE